MFYLATQAAGRPAGPVDDWTRRLLATIHWTLETHRRDDRRRMIDLLRRLVRLT